MAESELWHQTNVMGPPAQVLKTLLSLRIQEVEVKKDMEDTAPKKKFMNNKEKKKNLSRMKRKVKNACHQRRVT